MRKESEENMLKGGRLFSIFISFCIYFRHFWRKSFRTLEPEFHLISSFWPSLPADIHAAYENPIDKILVFKGNIAYHYSSSPCVCLN